VRRFPRAPGANGVFRGDRLATGFGFFLLLPKAWRAIASNLDGYMATARADVKLWLCKGAEVGTIASGFSEGTNDALMFCSG
jgi:hypothetical protein